MVNNDSGEGFNRFADNSASDSDVLNKTRCVRTSEIKSSGFSIEAWKPNDIQ